MSCIYEDLFGRSLHVDSIETKDGPSRVTCYGTNLGQHLSERPDLVDALRIASTRGVKDLVPHKFQRSLYRGGILRSFPFDMSNYENDSFVPLQPERVVLADGSERHKVDFGTHSCLVSMSQWKANSPTEDSAFLANDPRTKTAIVGLLDGHGKGHCAQVMQNWLPIVIANVLDTTLAHTSPLRLANSPLDAAAALSVSFAMADALWLDSLAKCAREGDAEMLASKSCSGSCALAVLVRETHVLVANLGDSMAVLFSRPLGSGAPFTSQVLTRAHVASDKTEFNQTVQLVAGRDNLPIRPSIGDILKGADKEAVPLVDFAQFKSPFPTWETYKDHLEPIASATNQTVDTLLGRARRVAGVLMVTRALGDAYLKETALDPLKHSFGAPYIHAVPEISCIERDPSQEQILVLGTDGIWELLGAECVQACLEASIDASSSNYIIASKHPAEMIVKNALSRAAVSSRMNLYDLMSLPEGPTRRALFDDMTCTVIELTTNAQ